jgi:hypothetical protein
VGDGRWKGWRCSLERTSQGIEERRASHDVLAPRMRQQGNLSLSYR